MRTFEDMCEALDDLRERQALAMEAQDAITLEATTNQINHITAQMEGHHTNEQ